jgi:hypothetical protein
MDGHRTGAASEVWAVRVSGRAGIIQAPFDLSQTSCVGGDCQMAARIPFAAVSPTAPSGAWRTIRSGAAAPQTMLGNYLAASGNDATLWTASAQYCVPH